MVYTTYKRARKFYNKYKKFNKLSKRSIFGRKSAKSQAKQIYALNKKVSKMSHELRPETIIKQCKCFTKLNEDYNLEVVNGWNSFDYIFEKYLFGSDYCNYSMKGNILKPYNFTLYGVFSNEEMTYVHQSSPTSPEVPMRVPLTGYLRIIVCLLSGGNQARLPNPITKSFESGGNDFGLINGPLVDNLTSSGLKVIKDKVVKIDEQHPTKMWRIKIRTPGSYRLGPHTGNLPAGKNEYIVYYQYYCPDRLEVTESSALHYVGPHQYVKTAVKFAFTDEGKE